MRDLGLLCSNKMLRPVGLVVQWHQECVILMSVVSVTLGPIWPWFRTARQQFHGPVPVQVRGPVFADPWTGGCCYGEF